MRKGFALPINSWSWFYQMGLFETRVPQIWIWWLSITIFPWKQYFSLGKGFDTSIPMFVGLKVFKLAMVFIGETTWCSYSCRIFGSQMGESAGAEKQKGRGIPEQSQAGAPSRGENCGLRLQTTDICFLFDCLTSCWTNKTFSRIEHIWYLISRWTFRSTWGWKSLQF